MVIILEIFINSYHGVFSVFHLIFFSRFIFCVDVIVFVSLFLNNNYESMDM